MTELSCQDLMNKLGLQIHRVPEQGKIIVRCWTGIHKDDDPSMNIMSSSFPYPFYCSACKQGGCLFTLAKEKGLLSDEDLDIAKAQSKSIYEENKINGNNWRINDKKQKDIDSYSFLTKGELLDPFLHRESRQYLNYLGILNRRDILEQDNIELFYSKNFQAIEKERLEDILERTEEKDFGTIKWTYYYKRLIVVFKSPNGTIINYEGRKINKANTGPKVIYTKGGKADVLWNIENCDPNKLLIIVEGTKDFFRLRQFYDNICVICGSALTKEKIKHLNRFPNKCFALDNDFAGWDLVEKAYELLDSEFNIWYVNREGCDPFDASDEELKGLESNMKPYIEYLYK